MLDIERVLNDLLFYDIEVFQHDALVVFKDIDGNTVKTFHNDFEGLREVIKGKTLVGYNNYFYDDFILNWMLTGKTVYQLKQLNDEIIGGSRLKASCLDSDIFSIDCFQQADVSFPSLKKIEANMGADIYESAIDFTIERKLTDDELLEVIDYCEYDVLKTIDVFKLRKDSYFIPKLNLIKMLDHKLQLKAIRWNTTTISANIICEGKPLLQWSDIRLGEYDPSGEYEMFEKVPAQVRDFWKANYKKEKGKITVTDFGCNIEFGFGGLHGVPINNQVKYRNVKLLDVASLYPNIVIKLGVLGSRTDIYQEIVNKRLAIKHSDKVLSSTLKLVINSVYGLLRSPYSLLKNHYGATSVCIYGQIILYDLCQRLSHTCKIVNINTDGVGFITDSDHYKQVWKEWEEDYGFILELEEYDQFIQKDVNNYIAIEPNGRVTCKGGDIGRYVQNDSQLFKNNSLRIVDLAVGNYLMHNVDPLDTIIDNLDNPVLYQQVLQAGNTYQGTYDDEDVKYQKVNRVFPVKKGGVKLYKKRSDGGKVMFPDSPDNMLVWNQEVSEFDDFKKVIDLNFYYQLTSKIIERWEV